MDTTGNTNSKNLSQYLHLYLGCKMQCDNKDCYGDLERYGMKSSNTALLLRKHLNGNWKPILRPLSDMTEEEMDYALNHISDDGDIPSEDFANLQSYLWHLAEGLNMADMFELTRKLIAKHFDIFGLIEAGLAIDKTTLQDNL